MVQLKALVKVMMVNLSFYTNRDQSQSTNHSGRVSQFPCPTVAPPPVAVLIGLADTQTSLRGDLRLSDSAVLTWTQVFCKHG